MQNNSNLFIRGLPIDMPIGKCYFIKMNEYEEIYKYQKILYFTKEDLYDVIEDILSIDKDDILQIMLPKYQKIFSNSETIQLIKALKKLGYYNIFKFLFDYFFGENTFDNIIKTDKDLLIYKIQLMGKLNTLLNKNNFNYNNEIENEDLSINEKKELQEKLDKIHDKNEEKGETNDNNNLINNKKNSICIDIIRNVKELNLYKIYNDLFNLCFKEEKGTFNKIQTDEELEQYIQLIINMNDICEPEEEIDYTKADEDVKRFDMYDKLLQKRHSNVNFESMYASLWLYLKQQPENLTLYQFKKLFEQLGQFKGYDATINGCLKEAVLWCGVPNNKKNKTQEKDDDIEDEMFNEIRNAKSKMDKVVRDI